MPAFGLETDERGIATITWDLPGRSMNVLDVEQLDELEALVDRVLEDPSIKGAVITSGKPDFSGGMDLNVLAGLRTNAGGNPAARVFEMTMGVHRVLRKIECGGASWNAPGRQAKPFAAALPGTALGVGYEIALACHRILAADRLDAKIGLPEIRVGLFPGGGGTTRLVRRLGLMGASVFLFEGRMVSPGQAREAGLVDEVVAPDDVCTIAQEWVHASSEEDSVKPWDAPKYRFPGGAPFHPQGFMTFVGANAQLHGRTKGLYPAARAMLSAIYEGALVPFDTALRIEARWFTSVALNPSSSAMINTLFLSKQALERGARRPAAIERRDTRRLAVLGAGMMGTGIGYVAAAAGIRVVLLDKDSERIKQARESIRSLLDGDVKRNRRTPSQRDASLDRIAFTESYEDVKGSDLIIEAVFEDPAVKADVLRAATAVAGDRTVIASNTSTLPISDLAGAVTDPGRFVGIHFFSPVHRMMLVEIIRGRETEDHAVARALDFARQIRKTPIVVNDARFFYANRCIIPYINEGVRMIAEGVNPALVENAAKGIGMPLGPLQLVDETSIDLGVNIARASRAVMGESYPAADADKVLERLASLGRLGRKSRGGFYSYDERGKRQRLWTGLRDHWPVSGDQPDALAVQHRLLLIQVLEAIKAYEDGVLGDVREGDVGAVFGWGFAPGTGGPFSWVDLAGAGSVVEICGGLSKRAGERFRAPALLESMARSDQTFYQ